MAVESHHIIKRTYPAGADLSAHQFKFVKLNSSSAVVLCAAATDRPIGVLQNKPTSGVGAEIMVLGHTKVVTAAATAAAAVIGTDANGLAAAYVFGTDTTKYIVGQVDVATGGANEIASALINCVNAPRGA